MVTTTLVANAWLFTGTDPIQVGVEPGTIELDRPAVLYGYVMDSSGLALPDVEITVLGHPEFGSTVTHADGRYDMAVNGGGPLTVKYLGEGFLDAQRTLSGPWDGHAWAPDVVLIQADLVVTAVAWACSEGFQVVQGSVLTDEDGTRQAVRSVSSRQHGNHGVGRWNDGGADNSARARHRVHSRLQPPCRGT